MCVSVGGERVGDGGGGGGAGGDEREGEGGRGREVVVVVVVVVCVCLPTVSPYARTSLVAACTSLFSFARSLRDSITYSSTLSAPRRAT